MSSPLIAPSRKNVVIGFDYSMSSPAMCIYVVEDDKIFIDNIQCKKKFDDDKELIQEKVFIRSVYDANIMAGKHPNIVRFMNIAQFFIDNLKKSLMMFPDHDLHFIIEGYAMGAKGVVFDIGENTAILKYMIYDNFKAVLHTIPPTTLKMMTTGKGNATKEQMIDAMKKDCNIDLHEFFNTKNDESPTSDIADVYWIGKKGLEFISNPEIYTKKRVKKKKKK